MRSDLKTLRDHVAEAPHAAVQFIDLTAAIALKVVMVALAGEFIARGLARQLHRHQPTVFEQRFDVAIDRGDAQPVHL